MLQLGDSFRGLRDMSDARLKAFRRALAQWPALLRLSTTIAPTPFDLDPASACLEMRHGLNITNTTIIDATYFSEPAAVQTMGVCDPTAKITVPSCRVQFVVNTSDVSAVTAEAWLPTEWYGRFLGLGNAGLGGCIDYVNLGYGSSMHFATVASNNGHDGNRADDFLNNAEVLTDFVDRAIHVEAVVGKQIVEAYYGRKHSKAYFRGCSTGGRQALYSALHHPDDFDGLIAGAPATNLNSLLGWLALLSKRMGATSAKPETSPNFISPSQWEAVSAEVLRQCDELDGVRDGVITDPDACDFRPEALLCSAQRLRKCLTVAQVETLRKIYEPLYSADGELLFPRYDPGAESVPRGQQSIFSGNMFVYSDGWFKFAIFNDSAYDFRNFGLADIAFANTVDPDGISTFSGDLTAFKARGGKLLTYQGRRDELIPSGNAIRLYNLISRMLRTPSLDAFYRLFLVPGMEHCSGGAGPVYIGEDGSAPASRNASSHNVLLALVEWVEGGGAPDTITGVSADGSAERVHCRYPQRSVWNGSFYICVG